MQLKNLAAQQQLIPGQLQQQQQQIQAGGLENQQRQMQIDATKALNKSYQGAVKLDQNGIPQIDGKVISDSLNTSGQGSQIAGVLENINKFNKSTIDIQTAKADLQAKGNDLMGAAAAAVKAANYDPALAHTLVDTLPQTPQTNAFRANIDDPVKLKAIVDQALAQSPKQQELANQKQTANAAQLRAENTSPSAEAIAGRAAQGDPQAIATQKEVLKQATLKSAAEAQAKQPIDVQTEIQKQAALQKMAPSALSNVKPNLVAPATAAYTKAGEDFANSMQASQNMEKFIQEAKSGNKEAVKIVPLQGALEITTAQGVHRINRTEVDQYGGAGNLYDKLAGHVGGILTGKDITDSVLNDMASLQKVVSQGASDLHANKVATINKAYGAQFEPMDFSGSTPKSATPTAKTGGTLTLAEAQAYLAKAGGDKNKARSMAKADGRTF